MWKASSRQRLASIVGEENVSVEATRAQMWIGDPPEAYACPFSVEQLCEIVKAADAESWRIAPVGNGTKFHMGARPREIDVAISTCGLNQITDYQPADLTITAQAGVRVADLSEALRAKGQMLPIDAPFADQATLGGVIAANASGPRRLGYGSLRDMVIGMRFVTAEGAIVKSGGKVVKNVAGYDMAKLLIGSFGTLGVIAQVTFKVFPAPPASITFLLGFEHAEDALRARTCILNSPLLPQALDLFDRTAGEILRSQLESSHWPDSSWFLAGAWSGTQKVIERVRRDLPALIHGNATQSALLLAAQDEQRFWNAIREFTPAMLGNFQNVSVIKCSVPLSKIRAVIEQAQQKSSEAQLNLAILSRAGTGIVYCYLWATPDSEAAYQKLAATCERMNKQAAEWGGSAVVEWCPAPIREKIDLLSPLGDDFPIMQRMKASLDPKGILNPGRLWGKI